MTAAPDGFGAVEPARDRARLVGWVLPEQPHAPPELLLVAAGRDPVVILAEGPSVPGQPAEARRFAWPLPAALADGAPHAVHVWDPVRGRELPGSPVTLQASPGPALPRAAGSGWRRPLAGSAPAGTLALAPGLSITAAPPAAVLDHALCFAAPPSPQAPPPPGVALRADTATRLAVHIAPPTEPAGRPMRLWAWLPEAPREGATADLLLSVPEGGGFRTLRRLRRLRLARMPAWTELDWRPGPEDLAEGPPWLTVEARDSTALCVVPPVAAENPTGKAGFEDGRLADGFAMLDQARRRQAAPPARPAAAIAPDAGHPPTAIVVPVHNGGTVVLEALRAIAAGTPGPFSVLVVDDASRAPTAEPLRAFVAADPRFRLHRRDFNRGYTRSINEGVMLTREPWVVVLNSDTAVAPGWLDRLHAAIRARPGAGLAGPLSNAASWQSVPEVKRPDGNWSVNPAIGPEDTARVQALLDQVSERARPEFPLLNGFCTLIARAVFDHVGLYDEDAFPMGYGEETDLCLRARSAGFGLVVADDAFVFHHKSLSFGAGRLRLTRAGGAALAAKHPGVNLGALERHMQGCAALAGLRARLLHALANGNEG